jgi:hypothetical protein
MKDSISNPGALKKCGLAPALTEPVREAATRLKVGKTALYAALRG